MNRDWKMELYWRLPYFLQEVMLTVYARKLDRMYYGSGYDEAVGQCKQMQNWSRAEIEAWQHQELRRIIEIAATKVPYYQTKWKKISWKSVHTSDLLLQLPLLDKQVIRQHEKQFLVEGVDRRALLVDSTSGTTGTALRIYKAPAMLPKYWAAYEVMARNIAGVTRDMPRAMMGGRSVIPGATNTPPYWRYNKYWHQLYLSSYHVSERTAPYYIDAIGTYGSSWLTGYGSAIAALAESAMRNNISSLPLRAVLVSGDTLLPGMRAVIEQFFQCRCYDHYGQSEFVCMAMECSHGQKHLLPTVGMVEIVREDGSPCVPGEVGEIIATSLLNDAMPFIRYKTGDYAAWGDDQPCPCGNQNRTLTKLEGRVDDFLLTTDGRRIGRLSTAMKGSPTIHSAQIVQDKPGHGFLLVRPSNGYHSSHGTIVVEDILSRIGSFDLQLIEVPEIPKTLRGKTRLVVRLDEQPELHGVYQSLLPTSVQKHSWS